MKLNDFTGFQFCDVHSSDLNIVRVSDGSRYNETLVPTFKDTTAEKTGSDGTLYWESFYTNQTFSISIAFDNLSEENFRKMRQLYSAKKVGQLIFDENRYKAYTVKIQSPPSLKYICFRENDKRVYKGEGTIQFIAYTPFARSIHKYLDEFEDADQAKMDEWENETGMLATQGDYDRVKGDEYEDEEGTTITSDGKTIKLYNPGDLETDWIAYYAFSDITSDTALTVCLNNDTDDNRLEFSTSLTTQTTKDVYLRINTKTNLIEGCDENKELTGTLYNLYIVSGDFFKIPISGSTTDTLNSSVGCSQIDYNYLYY